MAILKNKISLKEILKTLHADLIGKDSNRGITLTYGWMANQVGHFSLGFIPSFFVYLFTQNSLSSLIYVSVFWLLFEIYNASSPLYKKEYKGNRSFKLQWGNLLFDTFTDLCFFWLGAATFYLSINFDILIFIFLLIGLFGLFFSIRFWILTKLYQQNAQFPFQFRLSQWNAPISKENVSIINKFLHAQSGNNHFLVFGSKGSGKTTLMVGLANEVAIRSRKSTYTTFSKWVNLLQEDKDTLNETKNVLWNWLDSDLLLIDDINPGTPVQANKCTSEEVHDYIIQNFEDRNIKALNELNVAWVIGSCSSNETVENWKNMLLKLTVLKENMHVIDLDKN